MMERIKLNYFLKNKGEFTEKNHKIRSIVNKHANEPKFFFKDDCIFVVMKYLQASIENRIRQHNSHTAHIRPS